MLNNKEEFKIMKQATLNEYKVKTIDATPDKEGYINLLSFIVNHSPNKKDVFWAKRELKKWGVK